MVRFLDEVIQFAFVQKRHKKDKRVSCLFCFTFVFPKTGQSGLTLTYKYISIPNLSQGLIHIRTMQNT